MKINILRKLNVFKVFIFFLCASFLVVAFFSYNYFNITQKIKRQIEGKSRSEVLRATEKIGQQIKELRDVVFSLENTISSKRLDKGSKIKLLREYFEKNKNIQGLAIAYEPYVLDKQERLFSPFFSRKNGKVKFTPSIGALYDYTLPSKEAGARTDWYRLIKNGDGFTEPYWGTAIGDNIIVYSARLYSSEDKERKNPIGVVSAVYRLDYVRELVDSLDLGKTGYGFVVSKKGVFAAHPIEEYYKKERTLFEIAKEKSSKQLEILGHNIKKNESGQMEYINEATGQDSVIFFKTIPYSNLVLGAVFIRSETFSAYANIFRKNKILLLIFFSFFLIFLFGILTKAYKGVSFNLCFFSFLVSIVLVFGIGILWKIKLEHSYTQMRDEVVVLSKNTIDKIVRSSGIVCKNYQDKSKQIKTGILIKNLEYVSSNQVRMSGYIWQKYFTNISAVKPQFILPNAIRIPKSKIIYREQYKKNKERTIWDVSAVLDQSHFESKTFPLDEKNIDIAISDSPLNLNVFLVPDLNSYNLINPTALSGLDSNLNISCWQFKESFFSYQEQDYKTNLGVKIAGDENKKHVLHFNIVTGRNLVDPLISYLIPLLVAMVLLFVNLLLISKKRIMSHVSLMGGIFIGMIFAHSALRKSLSLSGLSYLEYFFIGSYLLIILMLIDFILYIKESKLRLVSYKKNLIFKVLFWPMYLVIMFLVTGYLFF